MLSVEKINALLDTVISLQPTRRDVVQDEMRCANCGHMKTLIEGATCKWKA